jgi:hypothetical protein
MNVEINLDYKIISLCLLLLLIFEKLKQKSYRKSNNNYISHSKEPITGDLILNNNTKCKHFQSTGKVLDISSLDEGMGKYVTYEVLNDGPTYKKGDILKKTMDQLTCLN